ncbi:hypothetical protein TSAR_010020 [Trichomalopsis sarcophagae]|uniref:Uncharacterized protein n=1 Tax=Trichomalopsis sarcophagae TaxID=543379 RepID=A0A232ES91_9HYME|nr:hypothetical protein TSAR_010020 [Trichomalopsis sarcophagae]
MAGGFGQRRVGMPMEEPGSSIPYVKIQKFLMNCCGIWPYNSRFVNCLIYSFFVVFSFTTIAPLSLGLIEEANNDIVTYFETLVAVVAIFGSMGTVLMSVHRKDHVVRTENFQQPVFETQQSFAYFLWLMAISVQIVERIKVHDSVFNNIIVGHYNGNFYWLS